MVNVNSIKQLVMAKAANLEDTELHDRIIVAVVAFFRFQAASNINLSHTSTMSRSIESIVDSVWQELLDKKLNYASYNVLKRYVQSLNKNNLLVMTTREMEDVHNKFLLTDLNKPFSTKVFDTEMYKITNIPYHYQQRLSTIHYTIMCPIIQYYHDRFGIPITNMTIYSVDEVPTNPGKVIYFAIGEVTSGTIVNDLKNRLFGVEKYIYSYQLKGDLVKLIIK